MLLLLLACSGSGDDGPQCETETYWIDADKDGFGDPDQPFEACALANGLSLNGDDCDDTKVSVWPGAPEDDCTDPVDYNCDGSVGYADADGDGSPACEDCDDSRAETRPNATELCNGIDDDCDGLIDYFAADEQTFTRDRDSDGYGGVDAETTEACEAEEGWSATADDCDDSDPAIHPGAEETCDGVDQDCDDNIDDNATDAPAWYPDTDGDGYGGTEVLRECTKPSGYVSDSSDCDDDDDEQFPGAEERCNDEDDDCDGIIDGDQRVPTDYPSIQKALNAASDGDLVCVDAGTYVEDLDFDGVAIRLHSTQGSDSTTVEGTGVTSVVEIVGADAELVGFTITGGEASDGAGVYVYGADPLLSDLVISDNTCDSGTCYGAGIYLGYSNAVLSDVRIVDNLAEGDSVWGAGLSCERCSLYGENVWISGNEAVADGYVAASGLSLASSDNSLFDGLVVAGNDADTAVLYASGVWVYSGSTSAFFNASIVDNTSSYRTTMYGEGVTVYSSSKASGTNVDVSGHEMGWSGVYSSSVSLSYSNVDNDDEFDGLTDPTGSSGNLSKDPLYTDISGADPGSWDLTLTTGSPLIDSGDPSRTDTDGTTSDIGAYGGPNGDGW